MSFQSTPESESTLRYPEPKIETSDPVEVTQDLFLLFALPPQVRALENISKCLDAGDLEQAVGIGLIGALQTIGNRLDFASTTQPDHPKLPDLKDAHGQAVQAYNVANQFIGNTYEAGATSAVYTEDERKRVIELLKGNVDGLLHLLRENKEASAPDQYTPVPGQ